MRFFIELKPTLVHLFVYRQMKKHNYLSNKNYIFYQPVLFLGGTEQRWYHVVNERPQFHNNNT